MWLTVQHADSYSSYHHIRFWYLRCCGCPGNASHSFSMNSCLTGWHHPGCIVISFLTHADHVFLGLPRSLVPGSPNHVMELMHEVARCTCPYHLRRRLSKEISIPTGVAGKVIMLKKKVTVPTLSLSMPTTIPIAFWLLFLHVFMKSEVWECLNSLIGGAGTAFPCVQWRFDHWF